MSYLHYHSSRSREHDPYDSDSYYPRQLVRRNSKRQRADIYDDNEHDDYPYSSKPSRALTIRQPSQLERYNVWAPKHAESRYDDDANDRTIRYKYTTTTHAPRPTYSEDEDDKERDFRLRVRASFGRPKSSHAHGHASSSKAMAWSGEAFKRRDKWEDEDWKIKERQRRDSLWDEEPQLKERTVRYRKIKRTRTDEWKPLSGFRRS